MNRLTLIILLTLAFLILISCRGQLTESPPIHLNPNMDMQSKYKAQKLSKNPPENTVPWGRYSVTSESSKREDFLRAEKDVYEGLRNDGSFIQKIPRQYQVDKKFLARGQERFDIYCAVCHDRVGTGKGTVASRGIGVVPNFRDDRFRTMGDGEIFNTISKGKGAMPAYATQIEVDDRWAIIAYIRALQRLGIKDNLKRDN